MQLRSKRTRASGRETACYGERSGLGDFTRDARVRANRRAADKASLRNMLKVFVVAGGNGSAMCVCAHVQRK